MNSTRPPEGAKKYGSRIFRSTALWIVGILLVSDFAVRTICPLKYVHSNSYIPFDQNPLFFKISALFSWGVEPEALVLGSSLPMTAIGRYDAEYAQTLDDTRNDELYRYTGAKYLEDELARRCGKRLRIFNLTFPACMASDAYLVLARALDGGKSPKIVFWGIAPRDFMDNLSQPVSKTPAYELLADWRCLGNLFDKTSSPEKVRDFLISSSWYYYKVKSDYRNLLTALTCESMGRQSSLYAAIHGQKSGSADCLPSSSGTDSTGLVPPSSDKTNPVLPPTRTHAMRLEKDLSEYKQRYNPPDVRRFEEEVAYLKKLANLCRQRRIKLVIVNMPITDQNRRLLAPLVKDRYDLDVCERAKNIADTFVDLDDSNAFSDVDFVDSVHVNAGGGKKVHDQLMSALARQLPL